MIILKILLLSYFISRFEPISWILDIILEWKANLFTRSLTLLLTCSKCLSFWLGLIMSQNIWIAIICSIIMFFYERKLSNWERIKFNHNGE